MLKQRLLELILGIPLILISVSTSHPLTMTSVMPSMDGRPMQNQCQSSCTPQSSVTMYSQNTVVDDKDIKPHPTQPYYLLFISVGWSLMLVASFYFSRYLHWHPPDRLIPIGLLRI